jgi:tetratricopeptide (TPR) repeat protein
MKVISSFFALIVLVGIASGQDVPVGFDISNYGVRIEPDRRVMAVLATIEAGRTTNTAGDPVPIIDTHLSAEGEKFRELLRSDVANLNEDLRQRISTFLLQHKRRNPNMSDAEIAAQFISMSFTLTPFPELADPVVRIDLPGKLLDVLDFAPLVRDYTRRSNFAGNLPGYLRLYQNAADKQLRNSAREMVSDLLTYLQTRPQIFYAERVSTETQRTSSRRTTLRTVETRERERKFFIVPELLSPVGNVVFSNIKDDYYAVLPPETDLGFSEARRAYLQFVIDPLVLNSSKDIAVIRDGVKQILDERRRSNPSVSPDVYLAVSRSLVAAIDAKQLEVERTQIATAQARQRLAALTNDDEKRLVTAELRSALDSFVDETVLRLSDDYDRGAILAFYFAEQLKGIEDSGFDISASMREMILSFDPAAEPKRVEQFAAARKRAEAARDERRSRPAAVSVIENPVTNKLIEIQETITTRNYLKASADLRALLKENPSEPRIFFNIGRVASLEAESIEDDDEQRAKLFEAKVAYENVIRIAEKQRVDSALLSLSYVALGRIYEFYGDSTYAIGIYDAAVRIGPVTGGAYDQAFAAKQRLMKDQ